MGQGLFGVQREWLPYQAPKPIFTTRCHSGSGTGPVLCCCPRAEYIVLESTMLAVAHCDAPGRATARSAPLIRTLTGGR